MVGKMWLECGCIVPTLILQLSNNTVKIRECPSGNFCRKAVQAESNNYVFYVPSYRRQVRKNKCSFQTGTVTNNSPVLVSRTGRQ